MQQQVAALKQLPAGTYSSVAHIAQTSLLPPGLRMGVEFSIHGP